MNIPNIPFGITDWDQIPPTEHKGESGTSYWRTVEAENISLRIVEYMPGFKSDHYCQRGHILLVLEGELLIKLKDGNEYRLTSGKSFQVGDNEANPYLVSTVRGAKAFIVD
jgi:quercetin dioxygenase-like cupin family protein